MHMKIKAYTQTLLYLVLVGGIVFACSLMNKGLNEFMKSQKQQTQAVMESKDLLKNTIERYERVMTFGLAKLAETNYSSRNKARELMDQAVQDEADFGDEKLAKIMNLFSDY